MTDIPTDFIIYLVALLSLNISFTLGIWYNSSHFLPSLIFY